jgi:hypothetical protein
MSKVKITGNASGTGVLTIEAPNTNTDRTITLPDEVGTVLTSATPIGFKSVQVFTSSGTYTKPSNINTIFVVVTGAGGSGGSQGTGGAAGGTAMKLIDASSITTETVTVAVEVNGPGGSSDGYDGGSSSFGLHCSATGGVGGLYGTTIETPAIGGIGSGGDMNLRGGYGHLVRGGGGGSSFWGAVSVVTPGTGVGNWGGGGRGGSGGIQSYSASGGIVVIYEYVSY